MMHRKILAVLLGLFLILMLGWSTITMAQGNGPDQRTDTITIPQASGDAEDTHFLLPSAGQSQNNASSQASVSRTNTHRIENYDVFGIMTKSYTTTWTGNIPTPHLHVLNNWDKDRISDISFDFAGGGTCKKQSDNDIYCTGNITNLEISWRYYFTPTVESTYLQQTSSVWSTYDFDYTFDFYYPSSLVYIGSTVTPNAGSGQNHLRWTRSDIQNFQTQITFQDSRIKTVFLPFIVK